MYSRIVQKIQVKMCFLPNEKKNDTQKAYIKTRSAGHNWQGCVQEIKIHKICLFFFVKHIISNIFKFNICLFYKFKPLDRKVCAISFLYDIFMLFHSFEFNWYVCVCRPRDFMFPLIEFVSLLVATIL